MPGQRDDRLDTLPGRVVEQNDERLAFDPGSGPVVDHRMLGRLVQHDRDEARGRRGSPVLPDRLHGRRHLGLRQGLQRMYRRLQRVDLFRPLLYLSHRGSSSLPNGCLLPSR